MKARRAANDGADDRHRIAALCKWFRRSARDLPWRRERERFGAWGALVAEAMLQQTQVARVAERYDGFMARFPTADSMAGASLQDVLALWQGLGYYRRARNLHAAAVMIRDEFAGNVPRTVDELLRLPGVGRYTAGAIASIMFNQPTPIVDGNVQRVLARWDAMTAPPQQRSAVIWTWARAGALASQAPRPGLLNEAMMELGATVCTPRSPRCERCPVARWCIAHETDRAATIPPPKPATRQKAAHHHAVLIEHGRRLLLEQRPAAGMWADLWQPPTIETAARLTARQLERRVRAAVPLPLGSLNHVTSFEHHTTHRRIMFHVYRSEVARDRNGRMPRAPALGAQQAWMARRGLARHPLSAAHRRVLSVGGWGDDRELQGEQ